MTTLLNISFVLITLLTAILFFRAAHYNRATVIIILVWLGIQAVLGLRLFYTNPLGMPPRFTLLILPPLILIVLALLTKSGKAFIAKLDLRYLTLVHLVRIPVELVLYGLFIHRMVPEIMTFAGRNWDILAGLSTPVIYYFYFIRGKISPRVLLLWNFFCLALLFNIVITAVLSAPFSFQQFGFDQPNVAIFYFPFVWLPGCVVPIVLFSHLAAVREIISPRMSLKV